MSGEVATRRLEQTRKKYPDKEILESLRQHPDLSASQWQKQKLTPSYDTIKGRFRSWGRAREIAGLEPRKCVMCGNALETWGKYCQKCRPLHAKEWVRERQREYKQKQRLAFAISEIGFASSRLGLPEDVQKSAAVIYKRMAEKKLLRGRSAKCMATAALYAACREHAVPQTMDDIAGAAQATKKEIARSYRAIARGLLIRPRPTNPVDYASRFCSELKLSEATQSKAIELLKKATDKGLTLGRGPVGVAAAAIYIASALTGEQRTQRDVADAARITEVTLRNRYCEMCEKLRLPWPVGRTGCAKKFTDGQLKELHSKGLTFAQIAQELRVSCTAVYRRSKRLGLPINYPKYVCTCRWCGKTFEANSPLNKQCPECRIKHSQPPEELKKKVEKAEIEIVKRDQLKPGDEVLYKNVVCVVDETDGWQVKVHTKENPALLRTCHMPLYWYRILSCEEKGEVENDREQAGT
jgi:transcription initiation factor TFIIIB Brf1 subunit/transcription initiation factor TFIIB